MMKEKRLAIIFILKIINKKKVNLFACLYQVLKYAMYVGTQDEFHFFFIYFLFYNTMRIHKLFPVGKEKFFWKKKIKNN